MAKHEPATLWRLVNARSGHLGDAIAATRTPFLLLLLWASIWGWQLYNVEFGWAIRTRQQTETRQFLLASENQRVSTSVCQALVQDTFIPEVAAGPLNNEQRAKVCDEIISARMKWAEENWLNTENVSFPGGLGRLSVGDLGIVGAFGMLLLLSWTFYSVRRENHALKSFVNARNPPNLIGKRAKRFVLECTDNYFSPEHLVYAYQLVSQRFVFLTSARSVVLRISTAALFCIPLVVVTSNFASDVPAIRATPSAMFPAPLVHEAKIRVAIEGVLLLGVVYYTALIFALSANTAKLLNGWWLAVRDVWTADWNEEAPSVARPVLIDAKRQRGFAEGSTAADAQEAAVVRPLRRIPRDSKK